MEVNQTIASAIKKPKKGGTRTKKKRLTFQDEVGVIKSEEDLKLKGATEVIATKKTKFLNFGFYLVKSLSHQGLDIVGATYNRRTRRLILADGKGLFSVDLLPSNSAVKREMWFQKYEFNMVRIITYSEKYNVYFVLQKDSAIKVYNKDYREVCSVENLSSGWIAFISFNPVKDEVITGGIKGVKMWKFKEKKFPDYTNPVAMFNYGLVPSTEYPYMGNNWCTDMDFDVNMQRFYCFSGCHFFCYDINGNMLFEIPNAHQSAIVSCVYSSDANILLTSSKGSKIKSWDDRGCLLHVFQGHTKTVTKLLLHPSTTSLFISGSLDGSVKLWSFDTMELFYSISPFQDGILWIGTMHNKFLYCCSARSLHIYDLNSFTSFWTQVHSPISNLCLCSADGKSSRVVAMGVDNSLRIFSLQNGSKLCTILPPPYPSPLQPVLSFTYNRANGTVYFLLTPVDIWVYTARTDPACRAAVWTIGELQQHLNRKHPFASCVQKKHCLHHTRKKYLKTTVRCECLCSLSSPLCYLIDEGVVYADNQEFLVLGMQDGRILFLHTSIQNLVYYEMTVYKDPVICLRHDVAQQQLIIMCQEPASKRIHFRSLPALELVYCVDVSDDTIVFTRLNRSLFVGLKSGAVDLLRLLHEDDQIVFSEKVNITGQNDQKDVSYCSEKYHKGAVVAVDSCKALSIFLSVGSDFIIKLWDLQKNLVAEITLDNTLSTACFLNNSGDILLAFKSDLYILPHNKTLGLSQASVDTSEVSAAESYIFESHHSDDQEKEKIVVSRSIDMESYLIPYKGFSFSEDFTSELLVMPQKKGKPAWKLPKAPSKIYCSPCGSEVSLKIFDFLLQPRTPNLEEQDKAEMARRMIVTDDMKYVPGPKPAVPARWEIPVFGVSPCASLICEQSETNAQPEEQVSETDSELALLELLQGSPVSEQQQINKEAAPEAAEIIPESVRFVNKKPALAAVLNIGALIQKKREQRLLMGDHRIKIHLPKHEPRKEGLGLKKIRTPKRARCFEATKDNMRPKDFTYAPYARSAISVDKLLKPKYVVEAQKYCLLVTSVKKYFLPLELRPTCFYQDIPGFYQATEVWQAEVPQSLAVFLLADLALSEELLSVASKPLSRITSQQKQKEYVFPYKKDIIRVVAWRKKENERIQQAEERRLIQELVKLPCSRDNCFTPNNSQLFQHLQPSEESFPETLFTWMKPFRQVQSRPYTVMEETTINLPRDFPYRLAWGTPVSQNLDIKLYHPKMKFSKDRKLSNLFLEKNLQPTKSIPDKGRYILVNDPISSSSTPAPSSLESKLLSVRFPKQKERILRSLLSDMQEPC